MTAQELSDLSHLYHEQIHSAKELLDLLQDEEEALRQRDAEELKECIRRKQDLLQQFEADAEKRLTLDKILNLDSISLPLKDSVQDRKKQLKTLMDSVQHQNRINAGIVKVSQDFTQKMLDIVRGQPFQQAMYNAFGQSKKQSNNQSLAKV